MTTYDWNTLIDSAGQGFEPLPVGDYDIKIMSAEAKTASTGKLMIVTKMQVQGGPHNGRVVWNNFVVTPDNPNAMYYFFTHMKAFGLDDAFFRPNPAPEQVAAALMNRDARISVTQRTYQGQVRNDIKSISALMGQGAVAPAIAQQQGVPQGVAPVNSPQVPAAPPTTAPQVVAPTEQPAAPTPAPTPPAAPAPPPPPPVPAPPAPAPAPAPAAAAPPPPPAPPAAPPAAAPAPAPAGAPQVPF